MRVAILGSRGYPSTYGGYETLVRYLTADWVEKGHDVTVYCRARNGNERAWFINGVRCIWTPGYESKALSTLSFGGTALMDAIFRRYDAILVLNVANGFYLPLTRVLGIPTAVNTDGIEWERGKWGRIARRVFYWGAALTARFGDVLIADSQAIGKIWEGLFGVRSVFIPYGAPVLENVGEDRIAELGLQRRGYVLVVARLIPENNVETILDALDCMSDQTQAVIVGSANYRSPLESRLRELDHQGRIQWLGHVADQELLDELWGNCGAYVHGHSVGGTNPGLLQALGAGAPTLALDTEFNQEVVECEEQLFPLEAGELGKRITTLLGDPERQEEFSQRGQALVASKYAWRDVSSSYLDALTLARDRRRAPR